jgi:branched-chain amino acid aminotransferase
MSDASVSSICYFNGHWGTGAVPLMTSLTNAAWLANTIFDGARSFEGVAPDLDLHCQRAIRSAEGLHLRPAVTAAQIEVLAREGIAKFPSDTPL